MFDSNGSNTTAAAAVANIVNTCDVSGKKAVILGGTGPVGQELLHFIVRKSRCVYHFRTLKRPSKFRRR